MRICLRLILVRVRDRFDIYKVRRVMERELYMSPCGLVKFLYFLKISLLQINSKLHSKSYDYLYLFLLLLLSLFLVVVVVVVVHCDIH